MFVNANGVHYYKLRRRHSDIVSADNKRSVYMRKNVYDACALRNNRTTHTRRRLIPRGAAHTMNMCPTDAQTLFPDPPPTKWQVLLGRRYSFYFFSTPPDHQIYTLLLRPETNHEKIKFTHKYIQNTW